MTTQAAMIKGYIREIELTDGVYNLHLLIKEDTDIEGTFKSWCLDDNEWLSVNGWTLWIDDEKEYSLPIYDDKEEARAFGFTSLD
jgi:hypothetical protein